jgi:hypothetical protein
LSVRLDESHCLSAHWLRTQGELRAIRASCVVELLDFVTDSLTTHVSILVGVLDWLTLVSMEPFLLTLGNLA